MNEFRELILTRFLNPCNAKGRECFSTYSISILCYQEREREKREEDEDYVPKHSKKKKRKKYIYIEISKQKFNTETNPERQLREKRERKKNTEIRTKWKLTSFLNAMNYDTMCSVLWLYLHDPFEVFPMLNNLRVMVFHLNFLHPTKPFGERNKIIIQKTVNDLANYCCAPFCMFMWHTKRIIKMKRFLKFLETEKQNCQKITFIRNLQFSQSWHTMQRTKFNIT